MSSSSPPPTRHAAAKVYALLSYDLVSLDECVRWARTVGGDPPRWVERLATSPDRNGALYGLRKKVRLIPPALLLPCMWLAFTQGQGSMRMMLEDALQGSEALRSRDISTALQRLLNDYRELPSRRSRGYAARFAEIRSACGSLFQPLVQALREAEPPLAIAESAEPKPLAPSPVIVTDESDVCECGAVMSVDGILRSCPSCGRQWAVTYNPPIPTSPVDFTPVQIAVSAPGKSPSHLVQTVRRHFPYLREQPVSGLLELARESGRIVLGTFERYLVDRWNDDPPAEGLRFDVVD